MNYQMPHLQTPRLTPYGSTVLRDTHWARHNWWLQHKILGRAPDHAWMVTRSCVSFLYDLLYEPR